MIGLWRIGRTEGRGRQQQFLHRRQPIRFTARNPPRPFGARKKRIAYQQYWHRSSSGFARQEKRGQNRSSNPLPVAMSSAETLAQSRVYTAPDGTRYLVDPQPRPNFMRQYAVAFLSLVSHTASGGCGTGGMPSTSRSRHTTHRRFTSHHQCDTATSTCASLYCAFGRGEPIEPVAVLTVRRNCSHFTDKDFAGAKPMCGRKSVCKSDFYCPSRQNGNI
jgi:hypothetical protein